MNRASSKLSTGAIFFVIFVFQLIACEHHHTVPNHREGLKEGRLTLTGMLVRWLKDNVKDSRTKYVFHCTAASLRMPNVSLIT